MIGVIEGARLLVGALHHLPTDFGEAYAVVSHPLTHLEPGLQLPASLAIRGAETFQPLGERFVGALPASLAVIAVCKVGEAKLMKAG